jgi:hypothetical protein
MATPLNLSRSYRAASADSFTAACPIYRRAQARRTRDSGSALEVSARRDGMLLCLATFLAVAGWIGSVIFALL